MVALDAELQLDIARALSSVDEIEAALTRATTGIPIELDLSGVTAFSDAIEQAVTQIAAPVVVTADTTAIVPEIDAAVASVTPDPVVIEADTTAASEAVNHLGSEAGAASENVNVLEGSVTSLGAATGLAEGSARELVTAIGELGGETGTVAAGGVLALAGATGVFFEEGLKAVSAGQRFDLVLGDMAGKIKEVDVNGLHISMEQLGIQFGSTGAEMENANSKLFQFAINAGATKDKAVEFTQQVETLAARAISLNPQLGTLASVTETLGPKLARGGRFAAEFGLALTPAEINARALADTGKTLTAELTVQEKAMAGAEIASDRYGKTLAGTVAEGQKNAAIQAESLKAKFKEAIEQIGVPLVAPVLELLTKAEPDLVLVAETLAKLSGDVLPLVSFALDALSVPLRLVDAVLSEIPGPLVTATAAFFALQFALDALAAATVVDAGLVGGAIDVAIPEIALAAAAAVAVIGLIGGSGPFIDEVTKAIDSASKGFADYQKSVHDTITAEVDAAVKTGDLARRLNDAAVSTEDLNKALLDGGDAYKRYTIQILDAAVAQGASFDTVVKLSNELKHLADATSNASLHSLESAVATGKITDAERTEAEAKAGQIDGHVNWARALDIVQPKIKAASDAADTQAKSEADAAAQTDAHKKALDALAQVAPDVAAALRTVTGGTADQTAGLEALALGLDKANLATKDFDAVASALGVTSEHLKAFMKDVAAEVDGFVKAALKGLPDVTAAVDEVLNPKRKDQKPILIDPKKLEDEITHDLFVIAQFNDNLQALHEAGLDNLAKVASSRGPEFTDALITSLHKGGEGVAKELDDKFAALNEATRAEPDKLRAAGAGIALATGDIADAAARSFGTRFQLVAPTQEQINLVNNLVSLAGVPLAEAWRQVGGDAAVAYEESIGAIPKATTTATSDTSKEIDGWAHALGTAAGGAGTAVAEGFGAGVAPIPETAGKIFDDVNEPLKSAAASLRINAYVEGFYVGFNFTDGLAVGIVDDKKVAAVATAAADVVRAAVKAANDAAGTHSPSKVMADLGRQMAAGLAVGLTDTASVAAAGAGLVATAIPRTVPVAIPVGASRLDGDPMGAAGDHLVVNVDARGADDPWAVADATAQAAIATRWRFPRR